jgi:hypothetical protein
MYCWQDPTAVMGRDHIIGDGTFDHFDGWWRNCDTGCGARTVQSISRTPKMSRICWRDTEGMGSYWSKAPPQSSSHFCGEYSELGKYSVPHWAFTHVFICRLVVSQITQWVESVTTTVCSDDQIVPEVTSGSPLLTFPQKNICFPCPGSGVGHFSKQP